MQFFSSALVQMIVDKVERPVLIEKISLKDQGKVHVGHGEVLKNLISIIPVETSGKFCTGNEIRRFKFMIP